MSDSAALILHFCMDEYYSVGLWINPRSRFLEHSSIWSHLKNWEIIIRSSFSMATVLVQYISPLQVWETLGSLVDPIPDVRIAFEKVVWWIKNRGLGLLWHPTSVALGSVILWWFEKRCFFPWQAISPQTVLHHLDLLIESLFHFFYPISKQSCAICRFQFLDSFRCLWFAQIVGKCVWDSVALDAESLASFQVEVSSLYIIWEIWISLPEKKTLLFWGMLKGANIEHSTINIAKIVLEPNKGRLCYWNVGVWN